MVSCGGDGTALVAETADKRLLRHYFFSTPNFSANFQPSLLLREKKQPQNNSFSTEVHHFLTHLPLITISTATLYPCTLWKEELQKTDADK